MSPARWAARVHATPIPWRWHVTMTQGHGKAGARTVWARDHARAVARVQRIIDRRNRRLDVRIPPIDVT